MVGGGEAATMAVLNRLHHSQNLLTFSHLPEEPVRFDMSEE